MKDVKITITEEYFWYNVDGDATIEGNTFSKSYQVSKFYLGPFFECGPTRMKQRINKKKEEIRDHFEMFTQTIEV